MLTIKQFYIIPVKSCIKIIKKTLKNLHEKKIK